MAILKVKPRMAEIEADFGGHSSPPTCAATLFWLFPQIFEWKKRELSIISVQINDPCESFFHVNDYLQGELCNVTLYVRV